MADQQRSSRLLTVLAAILALVGLAIGGGGLWLALLGDLSIICWPGWR